jgi:phage terminase large subunit-like protein
VTDVATNPFTTWDEQSQLKAAQMLKDLERDPPKVWYCLNGRKCGGSPHEGVPYNHARPDQWPPALMFFVWLIISGRGSGKTRTGSEFVRKKSNTSPRIAVIGRRISDIRNTLVEGESGLIRICERAKVGYLWEPSKRIFTFNNGSKALFYSGEEPDALRGPEHSDAWLDEPAHMALIEEVWSNLLLGLRLGKDPRVLCTSTPLPINWLKELIARPDTLTVRVSTYANLENLAPSFRQNVIDKYEGTRLGRQELHGEILEDVEGALWNTELIIAAQDYPDDLRRMLDVVLDVRDLPFDRVIVSVDPAGTSTKRSDETGIIVVGKLGKYFLVLDDLSGKYSPDGWAKKVVFAYEKWRADRVVAEKNYGGDMVRSNLSNQEENLPITLVTSRRGKAIRAEPVVALYEQGRVFHIGNLKELEDEQLRWVPGTGDSPNRIDAEVHGITELFGGSSEASVTSARGETIMPALPGVPNAPGMQRNRIPGRIYTP